MLKAADNQLLTDIGPQSSMAHFMRQYWMPVLMSSELEPGGDPTPLTMLGERFVAYRTPEGVAGLMDEACPHRGASMRLARNEPGGLRCIYHGWKISTSCMMLEAPTHPASAPIARMRTGGRPVHERHGMLWTWLGKGSAPPLPRHGWMDLPEGHVVAGKMVLNCSWLHPLETLWDTFHAQILHNQTNRSTARAQYYFTADGDGEAGGMRYDVPEMKTVQTAYGFDLFNVDRAKITGQSFVFPFFQYHPTTPAPTDDRSLQISVPIDTDRTLLWFVLFNRHAPLKPDGLARRMFADIDDPADMLKAFGPRTPENRWGQDREAMRRGESFAGAKAPSPALAIILEDTMLIESQGRLDRTRELLAPVDAALSEARRIIIDAVKGYETTGDVPARELDLSAVEATFTPRAAAQ